MRGHHMNPFASLRRCSRAAGSVVVIGLAGLMALSGAIIRPARAEGPGVGAPWAVSVGDSYISGEAGRWAGNTNTGSSFIDALGASAYFDNATATGEQIPLLHPPLAAQGYFDDRTHGQNLACSGARTSA